GGDPAAYQVTVPAASFWELEETLPTGRRRPLGERPACDLSAPRPFDSLQLDDVLTGLPGPGQPGGVLYPRGSVTAPGGVGLAVRAVPDFREMVVFTPPHRQAVALEPYTCVTDAINLQQKNVDAGLLVVPPGGTW